MKQSYLESLVSLTAKVRSARSQSSAPQDCDNTLTRIMHLNGLEAGSGSFSKINPHDTPVGINFANILAGIYSALAKSVQGKIANKAEK